MSSMGAIRASMSASFSRICQGQQLQQQQQQQRSAGRRSSVIRPKVIHLDKILAVSNCGKGLPQAIYLRQLPYLIKDIDQVAHVLKIVNLPVELEGSVTADAAQQQRF
jgi:membrane protease subunit (stomatin/prohibitin family)